MPITFDTPEELLAFIQKYQASELSVQSADSSILSGNRTQNNSLVEDSISKSTKQRIPPSAFREMTKREIEKWKNSSTLTTAVDTVIQRFLDLNQTFTEDDIYFELAQNDKKLNALPVLITIYRRLSGPFLHVSRSGESPETIYNLFSNLQ